MSVSQQLLNGTYTSLKQRLEYCLGVLRNSDLEGISGFNEMCFKSLVLGVLSADGMLDIKSEMKVKKGAMDGYLDLCIQGNNSDNNEATCIMMELKYLPLAYCVDMEQHATLKAHLKDETPFARW